MNKILEIKNLNINIGVNKEKVRAVRGVSFEIEQGAILALVGESGSGKSLTARSILKLDDPLSVDVTGEILKLDNIDIISASEKDMVEIRGKVAGMIFQDPMSYLNPTMKIGRQITEGLLRKGIKSKKECKEEAIRLLKLVQISEPELRAEQYPHELSGGMRQRVMIAMAMANQPKLIIADEPTTALDSTIQLQILMLLKKVQKESKASILIITHDLKIVANMADKVAVMYGGKIVEIGTVSDVFEDSVHPYTKGLLKSIPQKGDRQDLYAIPGSPANLTSLPKGCAFAPRCEKCMEICVVEEPMEYEIKKGHKASCWLLHRNFIEKGSTDGNFT